MPKFPAKAMVVLYGKRLFRLRFGATPREVRAYDQEISMQGNKEVTTFRSTW